MVGENTSDKVRHLLIRMEEHDVKEEGEAGDKEDGAEDVDVETYIEKT